MGDQDRNPFVAAIPLAVGGLLVTLVAGLPVFWPMLCLVFALTLTAAYAIILSDTFDHHASVRLVRVSTRVKRVGVFLAIAVVSGGIWYKTLSVAHERQRLAEARVLALTELLPRYVSEALQIKQEYKATIPEIHGRADPARAVDWEKRLCAQLNVKLGPGTCDELFGRLDPLDMRPDDERRDRLCSRIDERLGQIAMMNAELRGLTK